MNKSFRHISLIVPLALCVGACSHSHFNSLMENERQKTDTIETVADIPQETVIPEPLTFETSSEAIEYMKNSEDADKYMSGILPRLAEDELSYCTKLLNSDHPHFFIVDKSQLEIVVFDKFGREEKRVGMACSKNYGTKHKKRDNRTPEGFFSAKGVYNSTEWLYTDDDGNTSDVKGQFGPRFIRLNIPVTSQIGIHGTSAPWSIGHRRSHGCIRVTNENIMELVEYVDSGMPVIVSPGCKDMAVNAEEGYYVPSVATRVNGSKASPKGIVNTAEQQETVAETTVIHDSINEPITEAESPELTSVDSLSTINTEI